MQVDYAQPVGITGVLTTGAAKSFNGNENTYIFHNSGTVDIYMTFSANGGGAATTATANNGMILRPDEKQILKVNLMSYYSSAAGELRYTEVVDA